MSFLRDNHFSEIHCNVVLTKQLRNCLKFYELESYDLQRVMEDAKGRDVSLSKFIFSDGPAVVSYVPPPQKKDGWCAVFSL